jgi:pantoate--beta-alanine ligase
LDIARTIAQLSDKSGIGEEPASQSAWFRQWGRCTRDIWPLVRAARAECRRVVTTIFVNPKQFAPSEDLASYPRREAADLTMLASADVDLAFVPAVDEIYPAEFATVVRVIGLTDVLCGAHRAGHFDGVATVVNKLLLQSLPDAAYFGEKDYQQLLVVRRLVADLDIPVRIVGVPTVREPDGLALSSRNAYLSPEERRIAPDLARVLRSIAGTVAMQPKAVASELARGLAELQSAGFDVEYLEIRDAETLAQVSHEVSAPSRVFAAARLGGTRLNNMPITPDRTDTPDCHCERSEAISRC